MVIPLVLLLATLPCSSALPRLRGTSVRETALISDLLTRSAIARTLAAAIEAADVIVYVQLSPTLPHGHATTRFVTATNQVRFVRVTLGATGHPDDLAALLAHELQHAIEIARDPGITDSAGVRRLYRSIGEDRTASSAFETAAAQEVGWRVRQELASRRR